MSSTSRDPILLIPAVLTALLMVGFLYSWVITKHEHARAYAVMAMFFLIVFVMVYILIG